MQTLLNIYKITHENCESRCHNVRLVLHVICRNDKQDNLLNKSPRVLRATSESHVCLARFLFKYRNRFSCHSPLLINLFLHCMLFSNIQWSVLGPRLQRACLKQTWSKEPEWVHFLFTCLDISTRRTILMHNIISYTCRPSNDSCCYVYLVSYISLSLKI